MNDNYIIVSDFPIEQVVFQPEEVSEVKWISIDEMKKLICEGMCMINDIKRLDIVCKFIEDNLK